MKIQLDTDRKTVKLESEVLMSKLIETLDKLLPNGEWKVFSLETNTVINHWSSPIVVERYIKPYVPYNPWQPWYSTTSSLGKQNADYKVGNNAMQLKSGVFNVEA